MAQPMYMAQPGYGAPPQQPMYGAPQQPMYGAPQQPMYGAPQQPMYGAPPPQQQGYYPPAPQPQMMVQMAPTYPPAGPPPTVLENTAYAALSFLAQAPGLLIRQRVNVGDVLLNAQFQGNSYQVKPLPPGFNPMSDVLDDNAYKSLPTYFIGAEDSEYCGRMLCRANRGFTMHIKEASGADVLRLKRPFRCTFPIGLPCCCYTLCNPQEMDIITMVPGGFEGPRLGSVRQVGACCSFESRLEVLDANGSVIYRLAASAFQCGPNCCCHEFEFNIQTAEGNDTGASIKNVFPGCNFRGLCTRADNLQLAFPSTAPPEHRAALLGAAFLIDYIFFEKGTGDSH